MSSGMVLVRPHPCSRLTTNILLVAHHWHSNNPGIVVETTEVGDSDIEEIAASKRQGKYSHVVASPCATLRPALDSGVLRHLGKRPNSSDGDVKALQDLRKLSDGSELEDFSG